MKKTTERHHLRTSKGRAKTLRVAAPLAAPVGPAKEGRLLAHHGAAPQRDGLWAARPRMAAFEPRLARVAQRAAAAKAGH